MKFRRRFATKGRLAGFFDALRDRLRHTGEWETEHAGEEPDEGEVADPAAVTEPHPASGRVDEETIPGIGRPWDIARRWTTEHRTPMIVGGTFGLAVAVGYLLAAFVFFPAPIFAGTRAIPRVLGSDEARARATLGAAGFSVGAVERRPHAVLPPGAVIWQDPPPDVVAPEATDVALTLSSGPARVPVPDVAGYDAEHARLLLEGAGLRVGSLESTQAPTPRNVAVNTRPPAGTTLPPGTSVVLVVSVGAATIRVPTLTGLTLDEARLALETAGLTLGTAFAETTTAAAPGEIFFQEPSAGTLSAPGTVVNVRIARSPP